MVAAKRLHLALGRSHRKSRPKVEMKLSRFPPRASEKFVQGNSAPSSGRSFYPASHECWGLACISGGVPRPAKPTTFGFRRVGQRLQMGRVGGVSECWRFSQSGGGFYSRLAQRSRLGNKCPVENSLQLRHRMLDIFSFAGRSSLSKKSLKACNCAHPLPTPAIGTPYDPMPSNCRRGRSPRVGCSWRSGRAQLSDLQPSSPERTGRANSTLCSSTETCDVAESRWLIEPRPRSPAHEGPLHCT